MGPNDYTLNIKSPFEQAMLAYGAGRNDINQRQVMDEREQSMQLRAAQEERQQQQFKSQQADAAQRRAKAKAMQENLMKMRQMAKDGTLGVGALNEFALETCSGVKINTVYSFSHSFDARCKPILSITRKSRRNRNNPRFVIFTSIVYSYYIHI